MKKYCLSHNSYKNIPRKLGLINLLLCQVKIRLFEIDMDKPWGPIERVSFYYSAQRSTSRSTEYQLPPHFWSIFDGSMKTLFGFGTRAYQFTLRLKSNIVNGIRPARRSRVVSSNIGIRSVGWLIMRKIGKSDFPGESEKIISLATSNTGLGTPGKHVRWSSRHSPEIIVSSQWRKKVIA